MGEEKWYVVDSPASGFYAIGQWSMLLIFGLRMKQTFVGSLSIFSYSNKTITCLFVGIIVSLCLFLLALVVLELIGVSSQIEVALLVPCVIFWLCNYVTYAVLFVHRLTIMMRYKMDNHSILSTSNSGNNSGNNSNTPNSNNPHQVIDITGMQMSTVARYTLLTAISLISTLVTICVLITVLIARGLNDDAQVDDTRKRNYDPSIIVIAIDCTINCSCICLLFGFSHGVYSKVCNICHHCLKTAFIRHFVQRNQKANINTGVNTKQLENLLFK